MQLLNTALIVCTVIYVVTFFYVALRRSFLPVYRDLSNEQKVSVSIIIPARNEESFIENCLTGIISQQYDARQFEVIVVDDESSDSTAELTAGFITGHPQFDIRLIRLKGNQFRKKGALLSGITEAKGELIITRDADTVNNSDKWLESLVSFYEVKKPAMIICPVDLRAKNGFLSAFQLSEHLFLQSITAVSAAGGYPFLCNGANLAFSKEAFHSVGGYEGNLTEASGDDIFLLEKMRRQAGKRVKYLNSKEAAVTTFALTSVKDFFRQKVRWASKFNRTANGFSVLFSLILLLPNLLFPLALVWSLVSGESYKTLLFCLALKWIFDFLLLTLSSYAKKSFGWLIWFLFLELFNHIYFIVVTFLALLVKPVWKGRR